jgi:two-component system LytT family response regulator
VDFNPKGDFVLKIMVCDDEPVVYEQIKEHIQHYFIKNNAEYEILYCATAQDLLRAPFDYDILFLDIMLGEGEDGIEIGKQLRTAGNAALFCIITSREDRAMDGYEATVFRYLVKPIRREALFRTLDAAVGMLDYDRSVVSIKFKYETSYIRVKDILYVESYLRKRFIVTKENRFQTTSSWQTLIEQFSTYPYFFSPKKAYLVNLAHVTGQSAIALTMADGTRIKFADGKYEEFLAAFSDFLNGRK